MTKTSPALPIAIVLIVLAIVLVVAKLIMLRRS